MDLTSQRSLLAAVAAAAAFAVAGCGDDEEETDTAAQDTAAEQTETDDDGAGQAGSTVDVGAVEYAFQPPDPTLGEDGQVEISLTNEGDLPHALTIEEAGESSETIDPGQSTTLTTSLDWGEYTIFCPVGDHRQRGMEGTLTVGGNGGDDGGGGGGDSGADDDSEPDDDSGSSGGGAY